MKTLSFEDWQDKYGSKEYEEFLDENDLSFLTQEQEDEWLEDAYEGHISEYEDNCYSDHRDRGNTWDN